MSKPSLLVVPSPSLYQQLFDAQADATLRELADVTFNSEERRWTSQELAERIAGYEIVITGWGTPAFDEQVLAAAGRLRLVAHSAGTIRAMLPPAVFERGVAVTHAASALAPAVAEMSLLLVMLLLRQAHLLDRRLRSGAAWSDLRPIGMGREIVGARVGVIGAGYTGRYFINLVRALQCDTLVYDPYLSDQRAAELGVRKVALDELLATCPIVSVQAPSTPETYHMIGARELALLQDGAIFVNTARAHVVDYDALLAELRRGRIYAALDVFEQEPLPADSPFLQLDNVVVTPHVAGQTIEARWRQGRYMVEEIGRFVAGEPLAYAVTREMLETMA